MWVYIAHSIYVALYMMAAPLIAAVVVVLILALVVHLYRQRKNSAPDAGTEVLRVVTLLREDLQGLSNALVDAQVGTGPRDAEMCKLYADSLVGLRDALGGTLTAPELLVESASKVYGALASSDEKFERFANVLDLADRSDAAEKIDALRVRITQLGTVLA